MLKKPASTACAETEKMIQKSTTYFQNTSHTAPGAESNLRSNGDIQESKKTTVVFREDTLPVRVYIGDQPRCDVKLFKKYKYMHT